MGTPVKELREKIVTIRLTKREELMLTKQMKDEEYISISRYIRDKVLDSAGRKKGREWNLKEEVRKLVKSIRRIGETYNDAVLQFSSEDEKEVLLNTLLDLTREVKKKTDRIIDLAVRSEGREGDRLNQKYLMIQKIEIIGVVVADAELKSSKNGNQYTGFRVGVTENYGEEKRSTYYEVAYNRNGIVSYLKKGRMVYVSGRLSLSAVCKDNRAYLNAYITASDVDFCDSSQG